MFNDTFQNLVIDPPWDKRKGGTRSVRPNQGRLLDYDTMGIGSIFSLLDSIIFPLAAPVHNIWLWSIDKYLIDSQSFMIERGYKLHARMIWDKGNGVAPAFTVRYSHEYLLWFYKPKLIPVRKETRGRFTTVFKEKSRQHSRKPDAAYRMIDELYEGAKIDVFSREPRLGWQQWGNQTKHFG